jgi:hypothetical protein
MRVPAARIWLHLLLVVLMAIGPLSAPAGGAGQTGGCCCMDNQAADMSKQGDCCNPGGHDGCTLNHGCPGGHCAVSTGIPVASPVSDVHLSDRFGAVAGEPLPASPSLPPTPPPII